MHYIEYQNISAILRSDYIKNFHNLLRYNNLFQKLHLIYLAFQKEATK